MPNWCENDLVCQGKKDDLITLLHFVKGETDFDFDRIISYPIHLKKLDNACEILSDLAQKGLIPSENVPESGYEIEGYSWCVEHWGVKWNASEIQIEEDREDRVTIHFNTPWAPPIPIFKKLGSLFPRIQFTLYYYERGQMFHGRLMYTKYGYDEHEGTYYGPRGG